MDKQIDLEKYNLRTDIAFESMNEDDKDNLVKSYTKNNIKVDKAIIDETVAKQISKNSGVYLTISYEDITDSNNYKEVKTLLIKELSLLIKNIISSESDLVLICGLGNEKVTPDALGPQVINNVIVTRHLFNLQQVSQGYQNTAAISFGVTGTTGMETKEVLEVIVKRIKPKLVIVVDALATSQVENMLKTIQVTTSGIAPGSGVGNMREEISKKSLDCDILAIGVPTVVDSLTIISSVFTYINKYFSYNIKNKDNKAMKLIMPGTKNYLKEELDPLKEEEKKTFLGLLGTLKDDELKSFIEEVIEPLGLNLMVTPKEIDFVIDKLSCLIAESLNEVLHRQLLP